MVCGGDRASTIRTTPPARITPVDTAATTPAIARVRKPPVTMSPKSCVSSGSTIAVPVIVFHQLQLVVCAALARRLAAD